MGNKKKRHHTGLRLLLFLCMFCNKTMNGNGMDLAKILNDSLLGALQRAVNHHRLDLVLDSDTNAHTHTRTNTTPYLGGTKGRRLSTPKIMTWIEFVHALQRKYKRRHGKPLLLKHAMKRASRHWPVYLQTFA